MDKTELVTLVSTKTGLNEQMATLAVDTVIAFLKQSFPPNFPGNWIPCYPAKSLPPEYWVRLRGFSERRIVRLCRANISTVEIATARASRTEAVAFPLAFGRARIVSDAFGHVSLTQRWSFLRILVFPDSKKDRLTETVIPRPLREFYLADHHRLDPMAPLHFGSGQSLVPTAPASRREVKKGTLFDPDFFQFRKETAQKLIAKAGSDSAANLNFLPS